MRRGTMQKQKRKTMEAILFFALAAAVSAAGYLATVRAAGRSLLRAGDKTAALHYALKNFRHVSPEMVRRLIKEGANVNYIGNFNEPPLVAALSRRRSLPVIRELLAAGARVEGVGDLKKNPLVAAIFYRNRPEVVQELLAAGADAKICLEGDGSSLLMLAAGFYHREELLEILLGRGNRLDARNDDGMTALMAAARFGRSGRNLRKLLALGADKSLADNDNRTAADYLRGNFHLNWRPSLRRLLPKEKKPCAKGVQRHGI